MEMQKSIGELKAAVENMDSTLKSTKSKVDTLVEWKNKILGGAIVLGTVCALLGFAVTKFSDWVTISKPEKQHVQVNEPAQLVPQATQSAPRAQKK